MIPDWNNHPVIRSYTRVWCVVVILSTVRRVLNQLESFQFTTVKGLEGFMFSTLTWKDVLGAKSA